MIESGQILPSARARLSTDDIVLPTAYELRSDEKVGSVRERNMLTEDGKSVHRFQIVTVIRNDREVEFIRSLGPATNFAGVEEITLISMFEDTADQVLYEVEEMRAAQTAKPFVEEWQATSTLIEDAIQQTEEKRLRLLNRSSFSANPAGVMAQRTGTHRKK